MKRIAAFIIFFVLVVGILSAQGKATKPVLPEKYKKWLEEEVVYIITSKERNVFGKLETDRERDIFIEAFWKHRDPTPGTPRNEFKEEHNKRWGYANEYFGRGTPRPGWMTDMGRIYIVLGPPQNIEAHENIMNVYPTQIWFYLGDPAYGLPSGFHIIFFKKQGTGEYALYSPVDDGPQSLIADYMQNAKDDRDAYEQLVKLAPNLAYQTLTLVPGERVFPGAVSLASTRLLANVFSYPQKKVEDAYADALLKYKDVIEVDYSANYISSDSFVSVVKNDAGFYFVQYSIEPKKISVDSYEDKYSTNFELDGRISDANGNTVFQYTKEMPISFTGEQLKDLGATSLAIQDMFPLVPGTYRFDLLFKNTVSKEFASLEKTILIPEESAAPVMTSLVLGYRFEKGAPSGQDFIPFRTRNGQLLCQARMTFSKKDSLFAFFQVLGLNPEVRGQGKIRFVFYKRDVEFLTKTREIVEYTSHPDFLEEFALTEFPPDYYKIRVAVLDEKGNEVLATDEDFEVTTVPDVPRPLIVAKVMPASRAEEYDYTLGIQMLNLGKNKEALALLDKAYQKNPAQLKYALGMSQVLYAGIEYQKVKDILARFAGGEQGLDQIYYFLGKSCHGLGQYAEAATYYRDYLSRFGLNLEILNLLGMAYHRLGNSAEALQAWRKSLEINPNQEDIKKLVETLQGKKQK